MLRINSITTTTWAAIQERARAFSTQISANTQLEVLPERIRCWDISGKGTRFFHADLLYSASEGRIYLIRGEDERAAPELDTYQDLVAQFLKEFLT